MPCNNSISLVTQEQSIEKIAAEKHVIFPPRKPNEITDQPTKMNEIKPKNEMQWNENERSTQIVCAFSFASCDIDIEFCSYICIRGCQDRFVCVRKKEKKKNN